jgi:hypothetical protein
MPDIHAVELILPPASKEQIAAATQVCVDLKIARDAIDRVIESVRLVVSQADRSTGSPAERLGDAEEIQGE